MLRTLCTYVDHVEMTILTTQLSLTELFRYELHLVCLFSFHMSNSRTNSSSRNVTNDDGDADRVR